MDIASAVRHIDSLVIDMIIKMVEAQQYADDATYRARGKRGAAMKCSNVVARDRLRPSRVWE